MNNLFLFAIFTRSLDNYHNKYNLTHLISSVFYYDNPSLDFSNLIKYDKSNYSYIMLVNPLDLNKINSLVIENIDNLTVDGPNIKINENKLVIFEINMLWLLLNYTNSDYYSTNKFDEFLLDIFINLGPANDKLTKENILNNILFIFINTEWLTLQLLFKTLNIKLSGGSISKRHYLSTSEFSLSKILFLLGLNDDSIYRSYMLHRNTSEISPDFTNIEIPVILFKLLISIKKDIIIKKMQLFINLLEKQISDINNNIKGLESESNFKLGKKSKISLPMFMKKGHDNEKKDKLIKDFKQVIIKKENELLIIKSQSSELEQNILKLFKGSYDEIKNVYIKYFHNDIGDIGSKKRIKLFNKKISIHTSNLVSNTALKITSHKLNRKEYSTFNVLNVRNMQSKFRNITDYSSPFNINNFFTNLIMMNRRYKSIYSNNSIISDNLMKILYSDNSKENIFVKIENYLI